MAQRKGEIAIVAVNFSYRTLPPPIRKKAGSAFLHFPASPDSVFMIGRTVVDGANVH